MEWMGGAPFMHKKELCAGLVWSCKPKPQWGIPLQEIELKNEFTDGAEDLVNAAVKFSMVIQQYDTKLNGAQDEIGRMQREQARPQDVDAVMKDLQMEEAALEKKVGALNGEILKTAGLQDEIAKLRAQVMELGEKSCRDAESAIAEASHLRQSRQRWAESVATQVYDSVQEWYTPRLARLGAFVAQREMVEKAVVRIAIDEALLNYVRKTKDVPQDFDAVIERLEAKVKKSEAAGNEIDEVDIEADDYATPCRPSVAELMFDGSPTRRSSGVAGADAETGGLNASETGGV